MTVPTPPAVSEAMREAVARVVDEYYPQHICRHNTEMALRAQRENEDTEEKVSEICALFASEIASLTGAITELSAAYDNRHVALLEAQDKIARLTGERDAAEKKLAAATETFTDDDGTVWSRPTAWAYFASCRALKGLYARAEAAEAETARLRAALRPTAEAAIIQGGDGLTPDQKIDLYLNYLDRRAAITSQEKIDV